MNYFQQLPFTPNHTIHNHTACHRQIIHITTANNKFVQLCIIYYLSHFVNNAHPLIKSKYTTHILEFSKYMKQAFIKNYVLQCTTS